MPSKNNSKSRKAKTKHSSPKKHSSQAQKYAPKFKQRFTRNGTPMRKPKTNKPDIQVKKSTYSKTARAAVLADAAARQHLIEMGGENTIDIIREFDRDMSDEELARKTGIKASDVRVVLNRLHSEGLFSYTRVRDRDSGWYSYIWKMSEEKLREFTPAEAQDGETTEMVDGEAYFCQNCAPEKLVSFEEATDARFKCGSCGSDLSFFERKKR
ncbi:Transcription factor E [uncultured archaeon]|nr:Transcription factor E [uncultured archaeon]